MFVIEIFSFKHILYMKLSPKIMKMVAFLIKIS